ncbi:hypothetical protein DBB30_22290 [Yersinia pestis]|nr:hypothetical protein C6P84_11260 [Yersinia pestis]PWF33983.1 hypothetical protein DBB30_22290 [Yersinia pestis]
MDISHFLTQFINELYFFDTFYLYLYLYLYFYFYFYQYLLGFDLRSTFELPNEERRQGKRAGRPF